MKTTQLINGSPDGSRPVVFVWDNFGPLHADRADAVARTTGKRVVGIELNGTSDEYEWISARRSSFEKITLSGVRSSRIASALRLFGLLIKLRPRVVFFCNYDRPEIFLSSIICRVCGFSPFTMNDSKFDDYPRFIFREMLKRIFLFPYVGALVASNRSAEYLRFLGIPSNRIALGYDTISVDRVREQAGSPPAPLGVPFSRRHFTIVARLIPKKNISTAIHAYAMARAAGCSRKLVICGSGPLESELKALARELKVGDHVDFMGFVQTEIVSQVLASSLALILSSTEEQFGQAIAEAISMGVPVVASENCGARDTLVRTAVNGFIVEPDNPAGMAFLLRVLSEDENLWRALSLGCSSFSLKADVAEFVKGVEALAGYPTISRSKS